VSVIGGSVSGSSAEATAAISNVMIQKDRMTDSPLLECLSMTDD
jgi:hypothetical protein